METFNLNYQKQLFNVVQKTVELKTSILNESFLLANSGKEKKMDSALETLNSIKKKQVKLNDPNIKEILLLLQFIDETVLKLEGRLELKNGFKNEVFDKEVYLEQKPVTQGS